MAEKFDIIRFLLINIYELMSCLSLRCDNNYKDKIRKVLLKSIFFDIFKYENVWEFRKTIKISGM